MKTISNDDLKEILRKHALWLNNDPEGEKADLSGADLTGADLRGVYLYKADLSGAGLRWADLWGADLSKADLSKADLTGADLYKANLYRADLRWANLNEADLRWANLNEADLYKADLWGADLSKADLSKADPTGADLSEAKIDWPLVCPEKGSFIGYKKCRGGLIVELEIPEDALRSSATTRKCRCSKAKVLSITNLNGSKSKSTEATSKRDPSFVYKVGEIVEVPDFDTNRFNECSTGIHFFVTREEAEKYLY